MQGISEPGPKITPFFGWRRGLSFMRAPMASFLEFCQNSPSFFPSLFFENPMNFGSSPMRIARKKIEILIVPCYIPE